MARLAIEGGKPVRDKLLPYSRQWIERDDIESVSEVLQSDFLTTGPKIAEFEEEFARFVGAKHAIAVSSGTAALHVALLSIDSIRGKKVVTSPLTFVASANAAVYCNARPVLADILPDSYTLNPKLVNDTTTGGCGAVVTVDMAGHPSELDELREITSRRGAVLVEDAAHALGATYRGKMVGSISDLTVFSFHPVKHVTTGEGGMITTDDDEFAERARTIRNHGLRRTNRWSYDVERLGYNYRMTDFGAALGLSQLAKFGRFQRRRERYVRMYNDSLADIKGVTLPKVRPYSTHSWHLYTILLNLKKLTVDREGFLQAMWAENIGVNLHYIPVYHHSYYKREYRFEPEDYPVAEDVCRRIVTLPLFPKMSESDVQDVVTATRKVVGHYAR